MQFFHELTPTELAYLKAFNQIESFGDEREDARVKFMTACMMSMQTAAGESVNPQDLDYMPIGDDEKQEEFASPNQVTQLFQSMTGGR